MPAARIRRTMMITPGNRAERLAKAAALPVDAIVFDLEDGVAPPEKPAARANIAKAMPKLPFAGRERVVRINAVGTADYALDMDALPYAALDSVFVPKVETGDQLRTLARRLAAEETRIGRDQPIGIIATIETPRGLLRALEIADAHPRTTALFFGSGDYSAETGSAVTERALAMPRAMIVAAAAAAKIQAIDAAYFTDVKDAAATRADAVIAKELGFVGKLLFHPNQIAVCNEVFTPSPAEIARAKRLVAAFSEARARGHGTAVIDGEFVAIDILLMAERTLATAAKAGIDLG